MQECIRTIGPISTPEAALALVEAARRFASVADWRASTDQALSLPVLRHHEFPLRVSRVRASQEGRDPTNVIADLRWLLTNQDGLTGQGRRLVVELIASLTVPAIAPALQELSTEPCARGLSALLKAKADELTEVSKALG